MNRDDIIKLGREAGFRIGPSRSGPDDVWGVGATLERFAALVMAQEREACAKLAITISEEGLPEEMPEGEELLRACEQIAGGVLIADAIRARR